ncbi:hypothetical protein BCY91_07060 [Pelobium manganitolerans]|uniref:Lipopolysaccharide assembly protein A domain-containing protein n=1 Tax=Pelobium manganitolerans TaxID=1842495 RepID=A0A419S593_9SPHI|nr:hypothetical protein [Pelobium manganitolerans]RKD15261.1 hypothetical protein BCY91_07060 [Pelobium manganitolerans]
MSFKTILIIICSVALTIVCMQNMEPANIQILWMEFTVAKLWMLLTCAFFGFVIGILVARPKKRIIPQENSAEVPFEINRPVGDDELSNNSKKQLSDEDRDYLY